VTTIGSGWQQHAQGNGFGIGPHSFNAKLARGIQRAEYSQAGREAGNQAIGAARTLGGNGLAAARAGATAASRAAGSANLQGARANARTIMAQQQQEDQRKLAEQAQHRQMLGGLLSGAGQLVGMVAPGMGQVGGQIGGMLGGALMGNPAQGAAAGVGQPQSPTQQQQAPQQPVVQQQQQVVQPPTAQVAQPAQPADPTKVVPQQQYTRQTDPVYNLDPQAAPPAPQVAPQAAPPQVPQLVPPGQFGMRLAPPMFGMTNGLPFGGFRLGGY
jgi:hypothetical protein